MFQVNTTYEKLKIEIENHRFLLKEILGFADNGKRIVFTYTKRSDMFNDNKEPRVAAIALKKDGTFRASKMWDAEVNGPTWMIGIPYEKKIMNKIIGKIVK